MKGQIKNILSCSTLLVVILLIFAALSAVYTVVVLNWARGEGVYPTPQEGVIQRADRFYCGVDRVEIEKAGTNSFDGSDPHVWYVTWRVYAKNRAPCEPQKPGDALYHGTYEGGGNFYLNVREGWVYMPEGYFPEYIGQWMKILNLAGTGDMSPVPRSK